MMPIVTRRSIDLIFRRRGYEHLEHYIHFDDIWEHIFSDYSDVLRNTLIFRDLENPLVAQILDEHEYSWRCVINSVRQKCQLKLYECY